MGFTSLRPLKCSYFWGESTHKNYSVHCRVLIGKKILLRVLRVYACSCKNFYRIFMSIWNEYFLGLSITEHSMQTWRFQFICSGCFLKWNHVPLILAFMVSLSLCTKALLSSLVRYQSFYFYQRKMQNSLFLKYFFMHSFFSTSCILITENLLVPFF